MEQQVNRAQSEQMPLGIPSLALPNSSEIGHLWTSYQAETISVCMLKQYVQETGDPDIRALLQQALDLSSQRVHAMETIFNAIHHPIPSAFGVQDVNVSSENLFNDEFKLAYTRLMHKLVLINYSQAFTLSVRIDIRNYFKECIDTSQDLIEKATDLLITKKALIHSPYIEIPKSVKFIENTDYAGSLLWGNTRPINAIELSHVISLLEAKILIRLQTIAFSQIVSSNTVRDHFKKSILISDKQIAKLESSALPKLST